MDVNCPKISVLMSVYNEPESIILESVNSILTQTFSDFELLIVNDNPQNHEVEAILERIAKMDSRIRIIKNERNVGLAISLNRAADVAKANYFLRMDSDDVSMPNRFEKEYNCIQYGYDLICSRYMNIDESSKLIDLKVFPEKVYRDDEIAELLPIKSVIHHPTVMITKDIFYKVGGYRAFPCAQDYDLWLRIMDAGAKFHMIEEPLLLYRIRQGSITTSRRIKQKYTIEYIRDLYIQRLKHGTDSFSIENYNDYIKRCIRDEEKQTEKVERADVFLKKANEKIYSGKKIGGYLIKLCVFLFNSMYRHIYWKLIVSKVKIYYYKRRKK